MTIWRISTRARRGIVVASLLVTSAGLVGGAGCSLTDTADFPDTDASGTSVDGAAVDGASPDGASPETGPCVSGEPGCTGPTDGGAAGDADSAAPFLASVSGTVHDELGAVVAGRAITLVDSTGKSSQATTAADGTFSFAGVPAPYDIVVSGAGVTPSALGVLGVSASTLKLLGHRPFASTQTHATRFSLKLPACLVAGCTFQVMAAVDDDATATFNAGFFIPNRGWAAPTGSVTSGFGADVGVYWAGPASVTAVVYVASFDATGALAGYSATSVPNVSNAMVLAVTATALTPVTTVSASTTATTVDFPAAAVAPTLSLVARIPHLSDDLVLASTTASLTLSGAAGAGPGATALFAARYTPSSTSAEFGYAQVPAAAGASQLALTRPPGITAPAAGATLTGSETIAWQAYGAAPLACVRVSPTGQPSTTNLVCLQGTSVALARLEKLLGRLSSGSYDLSIREARPGSAATDAFTGNYFALGQTYSLGGSAVVTVTRAP
jgi:Carboxypeptidase regulatory-like domain